MRLNSYFIFLCLKEAVTFADRLPLPPNFIWSTATSAYQVEGGAYTDGRGPSVWDTFVRLPNKIRDNATGDIACNSYSLFDKDIENMKMLGYRFSISWSRISPSGFMNDINQKGVDYYNNLIDALINSEIKPQITLYHWDLPQSLQDRGGWLNREIVRWFADYADFCYKTFGDRVRNWITLNEPWSQSVFGYCGDTVEHAPGGFQAHCPWTMYLAGHHMLLAHAKAYGIYKNLYKSTQNDEKTDILVYENHEKLAWLYPNRDPGVTIREEGHNTGKYGSVGISFSTAFFEPNNTSSDSDKAAASRDFQFLVGWFANPIFTSDGDYPTVMKDRIGNLSQAENRTISRLPDLSPAEILEVKGSADFIGLNYYTSHTSRLWIPADGKPTSQRRYDIGTENGFLENSPVIGKNDSWIHASPEGLRKVLRYVRDNYNNITTIITENGCMDTADEDLDDQTRIFYLAGHISAVARAISEDKVNVIGYTVWSIMDNFEWDDGFETKFGIYRTNFSDPNLTRIPKASAYWFANVTTNNFVDEIPLPPMVSTVVIPSSPSTSIVSITSAGITITTSNDSHRLKTDRLANLTMFLVAIFVQSFAIKH